MRHDKKLQARYFTVGLFSVIDAILDQPMSEILERLSLDDTITHAILRHEGPIGDALTKAVAFERSEWDKLGLSPTESDELQRIYLSALQSSHDFLESIAQANAA